MGVIWFKGNSWLIFGFEYKKRGIGVCVCICVCLYVCWSGRVSYSNFLVWKDLDIGSGCDNFVK